MPKNNNTLCNPVEMEPGLKPRNYSFVHKSVRKSVSELPFPFSHSRSALGLHCKYLWLGRNQNSNPLQRTCRKSHPLKSKERQGLFFFCSRSQFRAGLIAFGPLLIAYVFIQMLPDRTHPEVSEKWKSHKTKRTQNKAVGKTMNLWKSSSRHLCHCRKFPSKKCLKKGCSGEFLNVMMSSSSSHENQRFWIR